MDQSVLRFINESLILSLVELTRLHYSSLLLAMMGHVLYLKPKEITFCIGDVHLLSNHYEAIEKQTKRTPFPFPTLSFLNSEKISRIQDFTPDNFKLSDYVSWPSIRARSGV